MAGRAVLCHCPFPAIRPIITGLFDRDQAQESYLVRYAKTVPDLNSSPYCDAG